MKASLTPSHTTMKESQAFDSEVAANPTCLSPATNSDSEGEEINLSVHGVMFHDEKGEQKWTPVCEQRRKKVRLNEVQLQRFPPHCHLPTTTIRY